MSALRTGYLVAYNTACTIGWSLVLMTMVTAWRDGNLVQGVEAATPLVVGLQLASTLELVHVLLGIVKGGALQTLMQIGGRDICLFLTVASMPEVQRNWAAPLLYTTWALSEVIRYPFYATSLMQCCPGLLRWLRYSAFLLLYPMGFAAELGCFLAAYEPAKAQNRYQIPGAPRGSQFYIIGAYVLYAYAVGAPAIYKYMLRSRSKQLTGTPAVTGTGAAAADSKRD